MAIGRLGQGSAPTVRGQWSAPTVIEVKGMAEVVRGAIVKKGQACCCFYVKGTRSTTCEGRSWRVKRVAMVIKVNMVGYGGQ